VVWASALVGKRGPVVAMDELVDNVTVVLGESVGEVPVQSYHTETALIIVSRYRYN
jgi:hypothetical protein